MRRIGGIWLLFGALALGACGGLPLSTIGSRSSGWIDEPTVPSTVATSTTVPSRVTVEDLQWSNDDIEPASPDDPEALLAAVFARRQGDRFIQASRAEIAVALPELSFPGVAPPGAEWVSSQLVFDSNGALADDPSAAFGIWSAEPYSRSRSVAQMAVLRVATDPEGADELAQGQPASCARFADRSTEQCEVIATGERDIWRLTASGGTTLIWYGGPYRYELYGRSFVPADSLLEMSETLVPLDSIVPDAS